jgi:hypothetical protein
MRLVDYCLLASVIVMIAVVAKMLRAIRLLDGRVTLLQEQLKIGRSTGPKRLELKPAKTVSGEFPTNGPKPVSSEFSVPKAVSGEFPKPVSGEFPKPISGEFPVPKAISGEFPILPIKPPIAGIGMVPNKTPGPVVMNKTPGPLRTPTPVLTVKSRRTPSADPPEDLPDESGAFVIDQSEADAIFAQLEAEQERLKKAMGRDFQVRNLKRPVVAPKAQHGRTLSAQEVARKLERK